MHFSDLPRTRWPKLIVVLATLTSWLLPLTVSSLELGCNALKMFWELAILALNVFAKLSLMSVPFLDVAGVAKHSLTTSEINFHLPR